MTIPQGVKRGAAPIGRRRAPPPLELLEGDRGRAIRYGPRRRGRRAGELEGVGDGRAHPSSRAWGGRTQGAGLSGTGPRATPHPSPSRRAPRGGHIGRDIGRRALSPHPRGPKDSDARRTNPVRAQSGGGQAGELLRPDRWKGYGAAAGDGPVLPYPHPRARSACRWHHARDTAGSSVHPSTVHRGPGRRRPGTVAPTPCARARRTPWEAAHPRPVSDLRADFLRGTSRPRRRFGRRVTWTPPPPAGGYAAGQSPAGRPGTGAGHSGRCRCSRRRRGARGCTSLAGY